MEKLSKEEYLASLRRRSSGFSRGVSKYRGVARYTLKPFSSTTISLEVTFPLTNENKL